MSDISFLKKFLSNDQCIPELSQIYHHVYFRDMEARCLAGNDLMFRCVGISENASSHSLHYVDIIRDPATLANVLKHDQAVLDSKEIITFQENVSLPNKPIQDFFSIAAGQGRSKTEACSPWEP